MGEVLRLPAYPGCTRKTACLAQHAQMSVFGQRIDARTNLCTNTLGTCKMVESNHGTQRVKLFQGVSSKDKTGEFMHDPPGEILGPASYFEL